MHFLAILLSLFAWSAAAVAADRSAAPRELVVITKPPVLPAKGVPPAGEHFQADLGRALAGAMGLPVRYLELPRNRVTAALAAGDGDILCGYLREWIAVPADWSRAFIPVTDVVVSSGRVAALHALGELKGKRVGTVLGFRYPDFEQALGAGFVRDDALSESLSLQKMMAGRFDYVITTLPTAHAHIDRAVLPANTGVLVVKEYRTSCAVSRRGHVTAAELNTAIDALERSGELEKLLRSR